MLASPPMPSSSSRFPHSIPSFSALPHYPRTSPPSSSAVDSHRNPWPPVLPSLQSIAQQHAAPPSSSSSSSPSSSRHAIAMPTQSSPSYQRNNGWHSASVSASSSDGGSSCGDSTSPTTTEGLTAATEASTSGPSPAPGSNNATGGKNASATAKAGRVGRKRKRLQRACDPCHKAKRRCDGGLPCSNCDFSGRACSYSDSQGNAVQPTARARPPTSSFNSPSADAHQTASQQLQVAAPTTSAGPDAFVLAEGSRASYLDHPRPKFDAAAVFADNSNIAQEIAPYSAIIPQAYRSDRHGQGSPAQPSPLLALAIATLSASRLNRRLQASQLCGSAARLVAEEDEYGTSLLDSPTADTALGLVILALEQATYGKMNRAVTHSTMACRIIQDLNLPDTVGSAAEPFQASELCRLVCVAYVVDVTLSTLAGRPSCTGVVDLEIAASKMAPMAASDPTSMLFCTLLRSATVFAMTLEHQRRVANKLAGSQAEMDAGMSQCHDALSAWASDLPASLTFDDTNLGRASAASRAQYGAAKVLKSGVDATAESAWVWAFSLMHCFAEMAVCVLETAAGPSRGRREAACSNLATLLLETMDSQTRTSMLSLLPLLIAGHGSSEASVRVSQQLNESRRYNALDDDQMRRVRVFLGISTTSASYLSHSRSHSDYRRQVVAAPPAAMPSASATTTTTTAATASLPRPSSVARLPSLSDASQRPYDGPKYGDAAGPRAHSTSPRDSMSARRLPSLSVTFDGHHHHHGGGSYYASGHPSPQHLSHHGADGPALRSPLSGLSPSSEYVSSDKAVGGVGPAPAYLSVRPSGGVPGPVSPSRHALAGGGEPAPVPVPGLPLSSPSSARRLPSLGFDRDPIAATSSRWNAAR